MDNTPLINTTGEYEVRAPFTLQSGEIYTCEAIEGFEVLEVEGINVFETYYQDNGIAEAQYQADRAAGINIVTLVGVTAPTLKVPSSYISKIPPVNPVAYSEVVLSFNLGMLPDGLDLTSLKQELDSIIGDVVGVDPTVSEHHVPLATPVAYTTAQQLEAARQARIVFRDSITNQIKLLTESNQSLTIRNTTLAQTLINLAT